MARATILEQLDFSSDEITATTRGRGPLEDIRQRFRNNVHQANRWAKKILERKVRDKLTKGVPGETYDEDYAEKKGKNTGRLYGTSGPVDFRYSGRLWRELVGRGRAKPSEPSLQVWLGLKHPNRTRPASAPGGGGITYQALADILRGETSTPASKPGPDGDPFQPSRKGREAIARGVANRLLDQT